VCQKFLFDFSTFRCTSRFSLRLFSIDYWFRFLSSLWADTPISIFISSWFLLSFLWCRSRFLECHFLRGAEGPLLFTLIRWVIDNISFKDWFLDAFSLSLAMPAIASSMYRLSFRFHEGLHFDFLSFFSFHFFRWDYHFSSFRCAGLMIADFLADFVAASLMWGFGWWSPYFFIFHFFADGASRLRCRIFEGFHAGAFISPISISAEIFSFFRLRCAVPGP